MLALTVLAGGLAAGFCAAVAPGEPCTTGAQRTRTCTRTDARRPAASRSRGPRRPAPASALGVHEHEFRIGLSRASVGAGPVIVELANEGQDGHDLRLAPVGSDRPVLSFDELRSGGRATRTVRLPPGAYRLWCSLPGHEAAGMHAVLLVN
jgi:hypothetical protein